LRLTSVRIVTGISCLFFAAAAWRLGPHSFEEFSAQAQTAKPAVASSQSQPHIQPARATTTKSATIPEPKLLAAPGTEIYTAHRGEAIITVARHYLAKTSYLTSSELAEAIRSVNHKSETSNFLKANEEIVIPGILAAPIVEHPISVPKDFEVRAIYLTGFMAGSDHGIRVIKHWREVGGNAVVFDIKDSDGSVTIPFDHPLLGEHQAYIHDVPKLVHFLHQENMHAIARIAIFRDERLVVAHPELAVQSRKNHTAWRENGKLVWTDPSNPKVQEYNIALAKHVAQLGVDEIQFDYVRFPAEGDQADAQFEFQRNPPQEDQPKAEGSTEAPEAEAKSEIQKDVILTTAPGSSPASAGGGAADVGGTLPQLAASQESMRSQPVAEATQGKEAKSPKSGAPSSKSRAESKKPKAAPQPHGIQRSDIIAGFLKKAYAELHPTGVLFSLDVFGVMAWQRQVDLSHTGQDIVQMARYCDVLSPMIYPSHFFGMDNIPHPGDEPAHFIGESMDRFELITKGSGVVIRPWLQAFHWRTKTYSPEYIKIQVETAKEKGGIGFLFWNAANDYSKPYVAMPEMKEANYKDGGTKDNPKYFRGDELPSSTIQAALAPALSPTSETH
jgi:hypothetical protein